MIVLLTLFSGVLDMYFHLTLYYPRIYIMVPRIMMFDAYLVDLLALKDVLTDGQTDGRTDRQTFAFLELLLQLITLST